MKILTFISTVFLGGITLTVSAQPCLYQGTTPDARAISRAGIVYTPFPKALQSDECQKLRVATGQVQVFAMESSAESIQVTKTMALPNTPLLTEKTPQALSSQGYTLFNLAGSALQGGQRLRTGSSRGAGDDMNLLLPRGTLGQPVDDLIFDMNENDANASTFEWRLNGKPMKNATIQGQQIRFPAQRLTPGSMVDWKLIYQNIAYEGRFNIEQADRVASLKQALITENANEPDPKLAALRTAFALMEKGYVWDAKHWLAEAFDR